MRSGTMITARRESISQNPYPAVCLVAGAGLILGDLLKRNPSPSERIVDSLVDEAAELGDSMRDSVRNLSLRLRLPTYFEKPFTESQR